MAELPQGTVTLLFTDIEGSTRLLNSLGPDYEQVLAFHRTLLREAFRSHGGIEVDTQGDAFFYAFARARDAVAGAVAGQRALSSHDFEDGVELRVRMGVHTGEPAQTQEGYVGPDVHLGSRICSVAWGGQIVVSSATAALISGLREVTLRPLGDHFLKDIDERISLHQVVAPGLIEDFPALRSVGAYPTNLPPRLPVLIGRDQDVIAVAELITSPEVSVVTLVGPGGTGKTRLSLAIAAKTLSSFADGASFVDLSALSDASLVIPSIAQSLSLRETPGRSLEESLADHLASKEMLLVLDNFEQVMGAASQLSSLLEGASALKVLVTSRESLRISGERVVSVAPLGVPSPANSDVDEMASFPAVALFVARAQAAKRDFSLSEDNAADVADICRRLDGLPLALELAAARINLMSPSSLLARLDQGLKVLSAGRRDASDRQRTLRGAIAWSYELLSEEEQRLFRRLAAFAGGWSLEGAEAVCDRDDLELDVLDGLGSLVDKSLVRASAAKVDRFAMLETIREFALEMLETSREAEEIRRAHVDYFLQLLEGAEPHLIEADKTWLDQLDREHDNCRAALAWTLERAPVAASSIVAVLWRFWDIRGHLTEGRQWIDRLLTLTTLSSRERIRATQAAAALAELQDDYKASAAHAQEALMLARQLESTPDEVRALIDLGWILLRQGDLESASWTLERAVALSGSVGEPNLKASALSNLGALRAEQQRTDEAISLFQRSVDIAEHSGNKRGVMMVLLNMGELETFARRYGEARRTLHRVVDLAQEFGDPTLEAGALVNLGIVDVLEGHPAGAIAAFKRAFDLATGMGSTYFAVSALDGLAVAVGDKDPVSAARLFAASDALRARAGVPRSSREQALYQPHIDACREALTPEEGAEASHDVRDLAEVASLVRAVGDVKEP